MRANFLRYMGQAFARVSSIKKERGLKWYWQARKEATLEVAEAIPRFDVEKVTNPKIEAEIRAEQTSNAQIRMEARSRLAKELRRFWETERNAGFSFEEVDADMREEYLSALSWGLERENVEDTTDNLHVHQNGVHVPDENGAECEDYSGRVYTRCPQNGGSGVGGLDGIVPAVGNLLDEAYAARFDGVEDDGSEAAPAPSVAYSRPCPKAAHKVFLPIK